MGLRDGSSGWDVQPDPPPDGNRDPVIIPDMRWPHHTCALGRAADEALDTQQL